MWSRSPGVAAVFALIAWWAPVAAQAPVTPLIDAMRGDLTEVQDILTGLAQAPESGWLVTTREDYEAELDALLDDLLELALGDAYADARDALLDHDARLAELSAERASLVAARLEAPSEVDPSLMDRALLREAPAGSQAALSMEIASLDAEVLRIESEKRRVVSSFSGLLRRDFGVEVSSQATLALLYQLNGAAIVEAAAMFQVVRAVEARIGEIRTEVEDPDVLRRYYGVAALTRLILVRLYERHFEDYEVQWLPRLARMEAETTALIDETLAAMDAAGSEAIRSGYERNLGVQESILAVIAQYQAMLLDRQAQTADGLALARADAELALNTLRTLETAVVLSEQMVWSETEFAALMSIDAPELIPLDEEEITRQFLDVSRLLAGS